MEKLKNGEEFTYEDIDNFQREIKSLNLTVSEETQRENDLEVKRILDEIDREYDEKQGQIGKEGVACEAKRKVDETDFGTKEEKHQVVDSTSQMDGTMHQVVSQVQG